VYCASVTEHDLFSTIDQPTSVSTSAPTQTPFNKVCAGLLANLDDVTTIYRSLRDDIITNGVSGDGYSKIKEQLGRVSELIKEDIA
jgi:hypothetical protein